MEKKEKKKKRKDTLSGVLTNSICSTDLELPPWTGGCQREQTAEPGDCDKPVSGILGGGIRSPPRVLCLLPIAVSDSRSSPDHFELSLSALKKHRAELTEQNRRRCSDVNVCEASYPSGSLPRPLQFLTSPNNSQESGRCTR